MVSSEDQGLDEVILQVFEEHEESFHFPVATQKEARAFVKVLHGKLSSYDSLLHEIKELEQNFSAWRKGISRPGIGNRVIERINRPLQEILHSDGEEEDPDYLDQLSTDSDDVESNRNGVDIKNNGENRLAADSKSNVQQTGNAADSQKQHDIGATGSGNTSVAGAAIKNDCKSLGNSSVEVYDKAVDVTKNLSGKTEEGQDKVKDGDIQKVIPLEKTKQDSSVVESKTAVGISGKSLEIIEKKQEAVTEHQQAVAEKKPEAATEKKQEAVIEKKQEAVTVKKLEAVSEKKQEAVEEKKPEAATEKKQEAVTEKKQEAVTEKKQEAVTEKKQEAVAEKKPEAATEKKQEAVAEKKPEAATEKKQEATEKKQEAVTGKKLETAAEKKQEAVTEKKQEAVTEKKHEAATEKKQEAVAGNKQEAVIEKKQEAVTEKKQEAVTEKKQEATEKKQEAVIEKKQEAVTEKKPEAATEKKQETTEKKQEAVIEKKQEAVAEAKQATPENKLETVIEKKRNVVSGNKQEAVTEEKQIAALTNDQNAVQPVIVENKEVDFQCAIVPALQDVQDQKANKEKPVELLEGEKCESGCLKKEIAGISAQCKSEPPSEHVQHDEATSKEADSTSNASKTKLEGEAASVSKSNEVVAQSTNSDIECEVVEHRSINVLAAEPVDQTHLPEQEETSALMSAVSSGADAENQKIELDQLQCRPNTSDAVCQGQLNDILESYNSDFDDELNHGTKCGATITSVESTMTCGKPQVTNESQIGDGAGYVYVFTDSSAENVAYRVKVGASRFPHKKLQQALLFNIDMKLVSAVQVSDQRKALDAVHQQLNIFSIPKTVGWFCGPLESILNVLMAVAKDYPHQD